MNGGGNDGRD
ncbi:unnamed protein product, partial [Rotaria sp. Silwood1]